MYIPSASDVLSAYAHEVSDRCRKIGEGACWAGRKVKEGTLYVLGPPVNAMMEACKDTARFIKNNWKQLLAYIFAWGVIITGMGLMYGFTATSLPFTIGLGCGLGFGILTGILTVKAFTCLHPGKPNAKYNTLWKAINELLRGRDAGTRAIMLSIAVTVILAAAVVFPIVIGVALGVVIGNHLATKIGFGEDLGQGKDSAERLRRDVEELQVQLQALQKRSAKLEETTTSSANT